MLVLTRRGDQSIVFPELDISVQILRVRGNVVKVGIDAPSDITILRKEVLDDPDQEIPESRRAKLFHEIRNHVHTSTTALALLSRKLERGIAIDPDAELAKILEGLASIARILKDPSGAPPLPARPTRATNEAPPPAFSTAAGSLRALLVEDDVNQSELLAGYLKLSGFDVSVAGDGAAALDQLSTAGLPDVVLLDMQMPRLNGPETIARIRQNPALERLKVFAISGTSPHEFGVPEGPSGVDRWFPKPLDPETLVKTLQAELTVSA